MPSNRLRFGYFDAFHDDEVLTLRLRVPSDEVPDQILPLSYKKAVKAYKDFSKIVNDIFIKIGRIESENAKGILGEFIDACIAFRRSILSDEIARSIWLAVADVDVLNLRTNLAFLPWECMFSGDIMNGRFLGGETIICRRPIGHARLGAVASALNCAADPSAIILSKKTIDTYDIAKDLIERKALTGLVEHLDGDTLIDVSKAVAGPSFVSVVAHKTEQSQLFISDSVSLSADVLGTMPIRPSDLVLLACCRGSAEFAGKVSLAEELVISRGCTVVSSCLDIPAETVLDLVENILSSGDIGAESLVGLWRKLSVNSSRWIEDDDYASVSNIMKLFYCIQGNLDVG